MMGYLVCTRM